MKVKIEDSTNLSRDINTFAVLNTSKNDLNAAKEAKKKRMSLENRINNIEQTLNKILELIQK